MQREQDLGTPRLPKDVSVPSREEINAALQEGAEMLRQAAIERRVKFPRVDRELLTTIVWIPPKNERPRA